ncbi:hypothetical protein DFH08DRAFT_809281 [Mycena albidolilacea]|uniref:Uncharacterized protein n=1 Tax=Mycena albidolilacea TaxID=1033008 RepID=A0AAD7ESA1_9AGAR|nr:hypothetical protein DFH08DRAFT_809281 [Mycena albidolilacea]
MCSRLRLPLTIPYPEIIIVCLLPVCAAVTPVSRQLSPARRALHQGGSEGVTYWGLPVAPLSWNYGGGRDGHPNSYDPSNRQYRGGIETVVKIWVGGGVRASWVAVRVARDFVWNARIKFESLHFPAKAICTPNLMAQLLFRMSVMSRRHTGGRTHDDCGGLFVEESQIVGISFQESGVKARTRCALTGGKTWAG